jgi:hypothetical protein
MAGLKSVSLLLVGFSSLASPLSIVLPAAAAQPPAAMVELVKNVDRAANTKQISGLISNYAASYSVDGMNLSEWQQSISTFWKRYPTLKYLTTIKSWKPDSNGGWLETTTRIDGSGVQSGNPIKLTAQIESRQKIVNGKIAQQEIVSEKIVATSGTKPPTIDLRVPAKVKTNGDYTIEAIVQEPLGDDVMMGMVTERAVSGSAYNRSENLNLELLSTGGLFKDAKAPGKSGDYWLSVTFIRPDGMTSVTQRMHVLRRS